MNLLKNKWVIALLVSGAVMILWQAYRVQQANSAAAILGFTNFDYEAAEPETNWDDPANWDGYETGDGVPPKYK